jgi:glycosyltransferase involved in cell wall biosynthesis
MRIFYIIHYFPPELNGGATRASELARLWAEMGHDVTILTGFPNHPNGRIPAEYKGKLFLEEFTYGYRIRRTFIYATPNKGFFKRILNHTSLMITSVLGSMFKERPDVIIASSPPLFLGLSGYLLSRLKRVPYVFEVRDIWPQQAIDLGMLSNRYIIWAMEKLEFFLYRKASKVIGVAGSTQRILSERGLDTGKVEIIFNGTDVDYYKPGPTNEQLKAELGLSGKFIVSYIGTMGLSQGLTVVLDAAEKLEQTYPDIHFLLVGDGAQRDMLIAKSGEMNLQNVLFLPSQPRSRVPDLYSLSDSVMVLLRNTPLFRSTIPSKIFEIMACERPVILGVEGEAKEIVMNSGGGIIMTPENVEELCRAIIQLHHNEDLRIVLARQGREYIVHNYNRHHLAQRYLTLLDDVVIGTKSIGVT